MSGSNNPFPRGASVAAYLRDSGGESQELSTAQQLEEIRAWCGRHQLILSQVYRDEARPGSSTVGREALAAMLAHFRDGASEQGVIIWRSNRLGRNVNDTQFIKADLRRRGYIIHSLTDDIPEGPAGALLDFVLDWKDQIFLEQLSEDVKRGLRHNVLAHGAIPGTPPRGFMREAVHIGHRRDGSPRIGYRWVPDPAMTPLVQRAFEMRAQGATLQQISDATGLYKSKNCWPTFFSNEIYIGVLVYGGERIENYCPPIVSRALWLACQPRPMIHPRRSMKTQYLLSGAVICQECGHPMNGHSITGRDYYICSHRKRTRQCNARHIPREALEQAVINMLVERVLTPDNLAAIQAAIQSQAEQVQTEGSASLKQNRARLAQVRKEINNLAGSIARMGGSQALLSALQKAEAEERDLLDLIQQARVPMPPTLGPDALANLAENTQAQLEDPDTTRNFIRSLQMQIYARRDDTTLHYRMVIDPKKVIGPVHEPGLLGLQQGAPKGEYTVDLISQVLVRPRRAPKRTPGQ